MLENIRDLSTITYKDYDCYFFDSNVWIAYLQTVISYPQHYKSYIDFIDLIIEKHQLAPETNPPKIAITSLLISEIINRYMRDVAMARFYGKDEYKNKDFKKEYRQEADYKKQLNILLDNFLNFKDFLLILNDSLLHLEFFDNLNDLGRSEYDFNDFYFYHLARKNNIPIVTNDADFAFQNDDVVIITTNFKVLEKMAWFKPQKKK